MKATTKIQRENKQFIKFVPFFLCSFQVKSQQIEYWRFVCWPRLIFIPNSLFPADFNNLCCFCCFCKCSMRVTWNDTNELNKLYESEKKNVSIPPMNQTEFLFVTGVFFNCSIWVNMYLLKENSTSTAFSPTITEELTVSSSSNNKTKYFFDVVLVLLPFFPSCLVLFFSSLFSSFLFKQIISFFSLENLF